MDFLPRTLNDATREGSKNFIHLYLPLVDWAALFDNSSQDEDGPRTIFFKNKGQTIADNQLWEKINEQAR